MTVTIAETAHVIANSSNCSW